MLNKFLIIPIVLLLMAQVPASVVTVGWDKSTDTAILGYYLTIDGVTKSVGNPPINPSCNCPSVTVPIVSSVGHTITVAAYDSTETSAQSAPLVLPSNCTAGSLLQNCWSTTPAAPQWTGLDIGYVNPPGHSAMFGTNYTLAAGGMALGGVQDAFHFMQQPISTIGSLTVRLSSLSTGAAGIEWREDNSAVSRHVAIGWKDGALQMTVRSAYAAAGRVSSTVTGVSLPVWLRLTRASGNLFTAARSADGVAWTTIGSSTVLMPLSSRVGLFTVGGSLSVAATAQFDSLGRNP